METCKNISDYAIVIGINEYSDPDLYLDSPSTDAKEIYNWLISDEGGQIPASNVEILIAESGTKVDQNDIQNCLVNAMNFSLLWQLKNKENARRLYFYFSGHGISEDSNVLICHSLLCDNWPNANLNTDEVDKKYINPCTHFDEVVFWLDCCRTLSTTSRSNDLIIKCQLPKRGTNRKKTMFSYATLDHNPAYTSLTAKPSANCSLYTQVLLAALKYAGRKDDGKVTWRSVDRHLREFVPSLAQKYNKNQESYMDFKQLSQDDDPVFCDSAKKITVTLRLNAKSGRLLIVDSRSKVIKSITIGSQNISVELPPGNYEAKTQRKRALFEVNGIEESIDVDL